MQDGMRRADPIHAYAHGMDLKRFDLATQVLAERVAIDYGAVGGPEGEMHRDEVATFLAGLLGRPELRVHTAIAQVLASPLDPDLTIAYYAARHFRTIDGEQKRFFVYGWYEFALIEDRMRSLAIRVQATEGDGSILG